MAARADRVVKLQAVNGDVLLFSSGHFIRVLAGCWIGVEPTITARSFMLSTASLSALGYEDDLSRPVIRLWNDTQHVTTKDADEEEAAESPATFNLGLAKPQAATEASRSRN